MRLFIAWGYVAWIALFNLPIGIWAVASGHAIVGGVLLALMSFGLFSLIRSLVVLSPSLVRHDEE